MPVKLGSALYKFRKDQGLPQLPTKETPVKIPQENGGSRVKYPANWKHEIHGEFFNLTATDLVGMFPQLKLDQANLCRVRRGQQKSHKGWTLKKADVQETLVSSNIVCLQSEGVTNISEYTGDLLERGA